MLNRGRPCGETTPTVVGSDGSMKLTHMKARSMDVPLGRAKMRYQEAWVRPRATWLPSCTVGWVKTRKGER